MKTIEEVRSELVKVFMGLKEGSVSPKDATEMNNAAGKIINSCKVQMEYQSLRGEKPAIKFLSCK